MLRDVLDVYGRAPGGLLANGLAFAALFAIVPIALVTLGVAGPARRRPGGPAQLGDALVNARSRRCQDLIDGRLARARRTGPRSPRSSASSA